jgi:hypothetical protein
MTIANGRLQMGIANRQTQLKVERLQMGVGGCGLPSPYISCTPSSYTNYTNYPTSYTNPTQILYSSYTNYPFYATYTNIKNRSKLYPPYIYLIRWGDLILVWNLYIKIGLIPLRIIIFLQELILYSSGVDSIFF